MMGTGAGRRPRPQWVGRTLKVLRRIHLYLGLLLLPFALFFGASGVLFNHPDFGSEVRRRAIDEEARAAAGIVPWNAEALARRVVAGINETTGGGYAIAPDEPGRIVGPSVFLGRQQDGTRVIASLQLDGGPISVAERPPAPPQEAPPFAGEKIEVEGHSVAAVQEKLAAHLASLGYEAQFRAHTRPPAQLRFAVLDEAGRRWNVTWNSGTGEVDAIAADADRGSAVDFFKRLHLRHHYPASGGVAWFWALFADLTGLAMVAWSLTGMVMWWQLKRTRLIGAFALIVALAIGAMIFLGMAGELGFVGFGKSTP